MNGSGKAHCDICSTSDFLESHHIEGRNIPNPHISSNIANLCPSCHNKIHRGTIAIEGWFMTSDGRKLLWHSVDEQSISGQDAKTYIIPD